MVGIPWIGVPLLTRNCAPVAKKVKLKSTWSRRDWVSVMVSAIKSTAFEVKSGIRVFGADSFLSSLICLLSFFEINGKIDVSTRSIENPTHSLFLFTYGNGGDSVRVPTVKIPVWLIFSSVVSARATVMLPATEIKVARKNSNLFIEFSLM